MTATIHPIGIPKRPPELGFDPDNIDDDIENRLGTYGAITSQGLYVVVFMPTNVANDLTRMDADGTVEIAREDGIGTRRAWFRDIADAISLCDGLNAATTTKSAGHPTPFVVMAKNDEVVHPDGYVWVEEPFTGLGD